MVGNRKKSQEFILHYIERIDPSGHNKKLYETKFSQMEDKEFDAFMRGLEDGSVNLCIVAPNFSDVKITLENNFEVAEELGHNFFQRIRMPEKDGVPAYLTPIPYMVVDLPIRRQAQLLEKKISIPQDNNSVDDFTGQVTGPSKGSKISYPELQVLIALGLEQSLTEMLKLRGGDEGAFNAMNTMIQRTGEVSIKAASQYETGVKSKQALKTLLAGMMLKSTL